MEDDELEPEKDLERDHLGNVEIELDEGAPEEDPEADNGVSYDDDEPNLVPIFMKTKAGREALKKLSQTVKDNFDEDWEGSADHRAEIAKDIALLDGNLPEKTFPWKDACNGHIPSMLENLSRITARVESEVCGNWMNVFSVTPTGPDDKDVAHLLTLHGNWQIREKLPDFKRQVSKMIWVFFVVGDVTVHSYWDPECGLNKHEVLTPEEFIVPYAYSTMMPDYGDLPHYTKILKRYEHQLEAMKDVWYDVDKVIERENPSFDDEPDDEPIRKERAEQEGIKEPDKGQAPYKLLWYEGWLKLPEQDRQRWCLVIQDTHTDAILQLSIHEEANWQEVIRFERQTEELANYRSVSEAIAQGTQAVALMEEKHAAQFPGGIIGPMGPDPMGMQQQAAIAEARTMIPQPVPPPAWAKNPDDPAEGPEPPKKDPIRMFSHGVCFEALAGNLGLSMGSIQADLNRAMDTALQQFTDQATLGNAKIFLTTKNIQLPADQELRPGSFVGIEGLMTGRLEDSIMPLSFGPANDQLMTLVTIFDEKAASSAQTPSVLSGESGKSGETKGGIEMRIEQATKQLSVPAQHVTNLLVQVFKNNARLNATYLPEEEMIYAFDYLQGEFRELRITRDLYRRSYDVSIACDHRFASKAQRIAEANELLAMSKEIPAMAENLSLQHALTVKALQAREAYEIIPLLGQAPPPPKVFGETIMQKAMQMAQQQLHDQQVQQQNEMLRQKNVAQQLAPGQNGVQGGTLPPNAPPPGRA